MAFIVVTIIFFTIFIYCLVKDEWYHSIIGSLCAIAFIISIIIFRDPVIKPVDSIILQNESAIVIITSPNRYLVITDAVVVSGLYPLDPSSVMLEVRDNIYGMVDEKIIIVREGNRIDL